MFEYPDIEEWNKIYMQYRNQPPVSYQQAECVLEELKKRYELTLFHSEKIELYPEECEVLSDEIMMLRGLDEFEQRKIDCVFYYEMAKRR